MKLYNPNNEYVYWYLDEDYVGYSNEKEKFFELDIGKHKLTSAEIGRASCRERV